MNALDFINSRSSTKIPDMTGPGPSRAEIETLLATAIRVPDHGKLAPWRFIIFAGAGRGTAGAAIAETFLEDYPSATLEQVQVERERLERAPVVIAVVSRAAPHVKIPEWEQVLSSGAVAMTLLFAVHALGYAAKWVTEWYAYDRRVLARFGLMDQERIAGLVYIGSTARPPEERPRPALADVSVWYDG